MGIALNPTGAAIQTAWPKTAFSVPGPPLCISRSARDAAVITGFITLIFRRRLPSSRSVPSDVSRDGCTAEKSRWGEFGPGHNSFVEDEDGVMYFVYHARRNHAVPLDYKGPLIHKGMIVGPAVLRLRQKYRLRGKLPRLFRVRCGRRTGKCRCALCGRTAACCTANRESHWT